MKRRNECFQGEIIYQKAPPASVRRRYAAARYARSGGSLRSRQRLATLTVRTKLSAYLVGADSQSSTPGVKLAAVAVHNQRTELSVISIGRAKLAVGQLARTRDRALTTPHRHAIAEKWCAPRSRPRSHGGRHAEGRRGRRRRPPPRHPTPA